MNQAKCTTCGAGLSFKQGDSTSVCAYCQSTNIVENALALGKVEVDVTEDIKKLRSNLTTFVQQNSIDEILRVSQKLLDWIPQDFVALYFFGYAKQQQNQPRFLYDFFEQQIDYTIEEFDFVFEHLNEQSELRDRKRVLHFLSSKDNEFSSRFEKRYHERVVLEENYANIPRDIFVCFSSYNQTIADEVLSILEEDGRTCWISTRNLRPNDAENYWINIENAIQKASLFLVVSSEEAMRSKDVQREVELAIKHKKRRFELKIDSSKHTSLFKYGFDGIKWLDYSSLDWKTQLGSRVFDELSLNQTINNLPKRPIVSTPTKSQKSSKPILFIILAVFLVSLALFIFMNSIQGDPTLNDGNLPSSLETAPPILDEAPDITNPETIASNQPTSRLTFRQLNGDVIEVYTEVHGTEFQLPEFNRQGFTMLGWIDVFNNLYPVDSLYEIGITNVELRPKLIPNMDLLQDRFNVINLSHKDFRSELQRVLKILPFTIGTNPYLSGNSQHYYGMAIYSDSVLDISNVSNQLSIHRGSDLPIYVPKFITTDPEYLLSHLYSNQFNLTTRGTLILSENEQRIDYEYTILFATIVLSNNMLDVEHVTSTVSRPFGGYARVLDAVMDEYPEWFIDADYGYYLFEYYDHAVLIIRAPSDEIEDYINALFSEESSLILHSKLFSLK